MSKVKCIQISCKKCLILDVSAIERSVLGGKVSWNLKTMSSIEKCPPESVLKSKWLILLVWFCVVYIDPYDLIRHVIRSHMTVYGQWRHYGATLRFRLFQKVKKVNSFLKHSVPSTQGWKRSQKQPAEVFYKNTCY